MATLALTVGNDTGQCWYSVEESQYMSSWIRSSYWYSGTGWYSGSDSTELWRSQIPIVIPSSAVIASSSSIIVKLVTDEVCSPAGCYGVLSTADLTPYDIYSGDTWDGWGNGPWQKTLGPGATGYIAESDTYSDAACTTLVSGYSQSSGYTFYLKFNSSAFTAGTTYFLYLLRYIKSGDSTTSGWTTGPMGSVTATLNYSPPTYSVSYNANGGSGAPAAQTKVYGETLTLSSTKPTKASTVTYPTGTITISYNANGGSSTPGAGTGTYTNTRTVPYTFKNWNTNSAGTGTAYNPGSSYTANAGATLYAQWNTGSATETRTTNPSIKTASAISKSNDSITGYKVSYNANGGSSTPSAQTSTKTRRYTFSKWNTNSAGTGTNYNAATYYTFSANATLYAKWTSSDTNNAITLPAAISRANASAGSYKVSFNANGGSCSTSSLSAARTTSYSFAGWNTKANGSGSNYGASAAYTPSAATTLYAKWNSSTSTAAITLPTPSRTGYTFKGWSTSSTATSGTTGSYTPSGDVTLYATWQINQYTITIGNSSYGTVKNGSTTISSGTKVNYGTVLTVTPTAVTGYTTTVSSSTGTISSGKLTVDGNETITFSRSENTYYVYYKAGLSNSGSLPGTTSRKYTANATIATNSMGKSNTTANSHTVTYYKGNATGGTVPSAQTSINTTTYTANGWTTSSSNTNDRDYANGTGYGAGTTNNLTLYPNFTTSTTNGGVTLSSNTMTKSNGTASGYTVTYAAGTSNGGTVPSAQTATDTIAYTHNGWATSQNGAKAYNKGAATGALSGSLSLYPTFSSSIAARGSVTLATNKLTRSNTTDYSYTVTYNANGGSCSTASATATKIRIYTANGWTTTSGSQTKTHSNGASHQVTGALTLYPCFTQSTSGGSVTLPTPTRTGYTFKGWSTSNTATSGTAAGTSYTPTGNVTLYATWQINQYTISIYGSNYGTVKSGSTTISSGGKVNYGTTLTITPSAAIGYTITASSSTGTINSSNQLTVDGNEAITFTKTANTYTVTYKQGLATSATNLPSKQTRTYPNAVTLATNSMTKSNGTQSGYTVTYINGSATGGTLPSAQTATDTIKYTANGWTTSSNALNDCDYTDGASFGSNSTTNLVLYPNFTTSVTRGVVILANNSMTKSTVNNATYTVSYDANGGTCSTTSATALKSTSYTANGWTTTSGSATRTHANGASYQVINNLTLYPCFTPSTSTTSVVLPIPSRTGYTFKGWSASQSATSGTIGAYTPTNNVTLYAIWEVNTYTITLSSPTGTGNLYEVYGNKFYTDASTEEAVFKVAVPSRTGHTFNGYYNSNGTVQIIDVNGDIKVPNTYFTSNTTIYASWTPNTYIIALNKQGGSEGTDRLYQVYGTKFYTDASTQTSINQIVVPTRTGYAFGGYYTNINGSGNQIINANGYFQVSNGYFVNDTTLYAKWTAQDVNYVVRHYLMNVNGSGYTEDTGSMQTLTAKADSTLTLANLKKTFAGFTYGYGQVKGIRVPTVTVKPDGTLEIDLYYNRNRYQVNITRGTGISQASGAGSHYYGAKVTISATVGNGYTWKGWTGTYESTSNPYTFTVPDSNVSITANAEPNTYTYTLDQQGGTGSVKTLYQVYGTKFYTDTSTMTSVNKIATPTKTGYTFNGYYTNINGSGYQVVGASGEIEASNAFLLNNTTIYAHWVAKDVNYVVQHYLMKVNGSGYTEDTASKQTLTAKADSTLTLANLKKTFTGFTYSYGQVNNNTVTTTTVKPDGTLVIRLYYSRNQYNVTLKQYSGISNVSGSGSYYYGATVNIDAFVKVGYIWSKWTGEYETTSKSYSFTMPAHSVTLVANATPITYTIEYNGNGHTSGITVRSTHTYDAEQRLAVNGYVKAGYTFVGWNTKPDGSGTSFTDKQSVKNLSTINGSIVILYAMYEAMGLIYIGNGKSFDAYQVFIDNGADWDQYMPYIDNGSDWDLCS